MSAPEWPFVSQDETFGSGPPDPSISPSAGAPSDTPSPVGGNVSSGPLPPTEGTEPSTLGGVFRAHALDRGLSVAEADALVSLAASLPAGESYTRDMALHDVPFDVQLEAEAAHKLALERMPLSVRVHLENTGLQYHPRIFTRLVREGLALQDLDREIAEHPTNDPNDPRLRGLIARRYGRRERVL